jgi:hypothetical protein
MDNGLDVVNVEWFWISFFGRYNSHVETLARRTACRAVTAVEVWRTSCFRDICAQTTSQRKNLMNSQILPGDKYHLLVHHLPRNAYRAASDAR